MSELIDAHLRHLRAAGRSPATIDDRAGLLGRLQRDLPVALADATTEHLEQWLGRDGWAPKTRETYWTHIKSFYDWCARGRAPRLAVNPATDLVRPSAPRGLPKPVSDAQLRQALEELPDPWRLAVLLAAWCGMRAGEIARARREDFTADVVLIVGKGNRSRCVPVSLDVWAAVCDRPIGPLIADHDGMPLAPNRVTIGAARALRRVGVDRTLHKFRHWFGTSVQREYHDLRVTQELMGHSTPTVTAGYAAVTDMQRRRAIDALPSLALVMAA